METLQKIHDQLHCLGKTSLLPTDLDTPFSKFSTVNVVPGHQDIPLINAIVSERNTQISIRALQIANVDAVIQKLAAVRAQLEEDSARLRDSLLAHQALTSAARRVPPEILGEVFYHCLPKSPYITPENTEPPMVFTEVCRHWRAVALSTPSLWSFLNIHLEKANRDRYRCGCESWLARAKNVPLTIRVLNYTKSFVVDPTSVVRWLKPLVDRSSDLWWHGPPLPMLFVPEPGTNLPLQRLRVTSFHDGPFIHFPGPAECLRFALLQCTNGGLESLDTISLPWASLVELRMHFALVSSTLLVQLLARCDCLCSLDVSCLSANEDQLRILRALAPGSITHSRLRRLEVRVNRAGLAALFSALTLPALEKLDICFCYHGCDAWPHAAFMEMLGRSRCALKQLTVRSNKAAVAHFGEYLEAIPGLVVSTSAMPC